MSDRFTADEATLVEQPFEPAVELLERVVRDHDRPGPVGDLEDEGVAAADHPRRGRDDPAVIDGPLGRSALLGGHPMLEAGVDDDGHMGEIVVGFDSGHRLVELSEARFRAPLGGEIGSVDDGVSLAHAVSQPPDGRRPVDRRLTGYDALPSSKPSFSLSEV